MLRPQDIVVVLATLTSPSWTLAGLSDRLEMSISMIHASVKRATASGLLNPRTRCAVRADLLTFLVHGLRFSFPVVRGGLTRGMPTAYAAPPLRDLMVGDFANPPVWPDPLGDTRGEAWQPLYRTVPSAARNDFALYEALALADCLRGGLPRERELATTALSKRLT